jgi:predicted dehydrogenase
VKFMIAGLGSIGRRHLKNLRALGESDILLYRTHLGALPEDELAGYPTEHDLAAALAHKPDAVIVSNPTALHLDIAIPAARSGCHLLLEKPVSHSLDRIDQLEDAVQHGGGQVLVGYQFRFHPGLRCVKQLLAEGAIGRPLSVRAHWGEYLPSWHPWEDYRLGYSARQDLGGGVILTLSHPLDYLCWLFGEVVEVWALAAKLSDLDLEVEDNAEIGLRFGSGVLGSLHLDYIQRPPKHNLEIIGSHGSIRWDNADGETALFSADYKQWERFPSPEGFERNQLFLAQMEHFLEVIHKKTTPLCGLDDGIQALRLALAAHRSQDQGALIHL